MSHPKMTAFLTSLPHSGYDDLLLQLIIIISSVHNHLFFLLSYSCKKFCQNCVI